VWRSCIAGVLLVASILSCNRSMASDAGDEPASSGGPAEFRRLDEAQYQHSIEDIFGAGIKIPGRFEPPLRADGLLAIGDSSVVVTPSGFEQYEFKAREIAAQVMAEDRRKAMVPCEPQSPSAIDNTCARKFLSQYGRLLFRRPLSAEEMNSTLKVMQLATQKTGDFYQGLEFALARLLVSPNFLFRVDATEAGSGRLAVQHLSAYSLASRISFLLWDAPPDAQLLDAAASGELKQPQGLAHQVDRMIASPRFEQGARAFFSDLLSFDEFDGLSKDQAIFPKYNSQLSKDAQEQTLRMIVDLLLTQRGDYRDLFTTRKTFLNRNLGSLYKVPVDASAFGGWMPYTFGLSDTRAGILTAAAFLLLDPTHEGRSSPTIRGKKVQELLLCRKVPPPPPNVNFNLVQDTHNPLYKTARDRLSAHRDNPSCAGCHSIMDPTGLAMENFDAIGEYRAQENGAQIDASGTFEGKSYQDLIGLEQILHDSPTVPNCLVERAYEYGVGHPLAAGEREWIRYLDQGFAADGYEFPALMRRIATSNAFQIVSENLPIGALASN
jgi:hypothetical protein